MFNINSVEVNLGGGGGDIKKKTAVLKTGKMPHH